MWNTILDVLISLLQNIFYLLSFLNEMISASPLSTGVYLLVALVFVLSWLLFLFKRREECREEEKRRREDPHHNSGETLTLKVLFVFLWFIIASLIVG